MIEIDGSQKSGSGTILRYALTIASILHKDLHIYNIRSKKKNPAYNHNILRALRHSGF